MVFKVSACVWMFACLWMAVCGCTFVSESVLFVCGCSLCLYVDLTFPLCVSLWMLTGGYMLEDSLQIHRLLYLFIYKTPLSIPRVETVLQCKVHNTVTFGTRTF